MSTERSRDPIDELKALRAAPPDGLADEVMRRLALRPLPSARLSLWRRLTAPRAVTIQLRPATLLLGAAAALAVLVVVRAPRPAATTAARPAPAGEAHVASAPTLVRFALAEPAAQSVSVAGDFNGWRPDAAPLERGADGVWRVTLPLQPGRWSYSFVVDGKWVEDPLADAWRQDGFGGRNAVVRVGG